MDSISSRRGPRPEVDTCSQDRDSQETAMQALLLQGPPFIRWACKVQQRQAFQDKSRGTAWVAMTVAARSNKQVRACTHCRASRAKLCLPGMHLQASSASQRGALALMRHTTCSCALTHMTVLIQGAPAQQFVRSSQQEPNDPMCFVKALRCF